MEEYKLITLLKTFNKDEMKNFKSFVSSSFFTGKKNYPTEKLRILIKILLEFYPDFKSGNLTKEKIFDKIYPGNQYKDSVLRNLFSKLLGMAQEFLKVKHFLSLPYEGDYFLMVELYNRKLGKEFEKKSKSYFEHSETRYKDADYYYDMYRAMDYYSHYKGGASYNNSEEMQSLYDYFNRFYLLRVLQFFMLMINQQTVVSFSFRIPMLNEVLKHIEENPGLYNDIPEISIYYNLVKLFSTSEESYYYKLTKLKDKHVNGLNAIEQNNLYVCLGNYCIKQISQGCKKFHTERFKLDKEYLSSGLIDKKHFMRFPLFLSAAMNALDTGEYEWTREFASENLERIAPVYRSFAENYIKAEIKFREKHYNKALKNLSIIKIELAYYKQLVRNLTLKIYYELGYIDEALSIIDTSRHFLSSDRELIKPVKEDFSRFIGFTLRLLKVSALTEPEKSEEYTLIAKELSAAPGFRNKDWLTEKLGK